MASSPSIGTKVFISYSHADKTWLERLKRHLRPLIRDGQLDCWDDTHIKPGNDWKQEIRAALDRAQVAVLLISADFFASDFIDETELPPLLAAAQAKGVRILPVILSASRFARDPDLARFQAVNSPDRPLNEMPQAEQEKVLDRLAQTIESATLAAELESVKDEVKQQESGIEAIRVALRGIVTKFEIDYLRRLDNKYDQWTCRYDPDTYYRLKRLDDMGFVLPTVIDGDRRLIRIQERFGDESIPVEQRELFNMKDYVEITEAGKKYVKIYDASIKDA